MPRNTEPEWLITYRNDIYSAPRTCHLCEHYDQFGTCKKYNMQPPKEFTDLKQNDCKDWIYEIPF
jgi:hypothetical protein